MTPVLSTPTPSRFHRELKQVVSRNGWDLEALSRAHPTLVVFLRHLGCVYCRESLTELRRLREAIEAQGVRISIVHMGSEAQADALLTGFGLQDVERFSDPERRLYETFGLERASVGRLFGPKALIDLIRTRARLGASLSRTFGRVVGDVLQMPGVFLLHEGTIIGDFRPGHVSERPDYLEMAALEC